MWNNTFELPDGPYSVSDIRNYFEYIIKKYKALADNPPIRIDLNKIRSKITFELSNRVLSRVFNTWYNEITWKH